MPRMTSFAGDLDVQFKRIAREPGQLVVDAELGVWESKLYLKPADVWAMGRLLLNLDVLRFLLTVPWEVVRDRWLRGRGKP